MRNYGTVYVDGKALSDFGAFLTNAGIYTAPEPIYEKVTVEGRIGDLLVETGGYSNVTIRYPSVILSDFDSKYTALRGFLLARNGYCRIEDTYTPERFRLGRPAGQVTPASKNGHQTRMFDVVFDCKPQWYLTAGEDPIEIAGNSTIKIINPTEFTALPLIKVTSGTGDIVVNNQHATLTANNGATIIDSEIQDCYEGATNRNGDLTLTNGYPVLLPGENGIVIPAGMTVEITPRWWTL